jgi:transposase InsO family protein
VILDVFSRLRRRLDRPAPRDCRDRESADRPGRGAAGDRAGDADRARRPRRPDALEAGRIPARDLGVTKTHSRPYSSTDNPYSEAQFKTLKYRPGFPDRFDSILEARAFCREFFAWYNERHRHSGIGPMTPAAVHYGRAKEPHDQRARVLAEAYARTPERFVRQPPRPPALPTAAWINQPTTEEAAP